MTSHPPDNKSLAHNAILFSLGLVDVERALIEALTNSDVLNLDAATSRSPAVEAEVQRLAENTPFKIDVHSALFIPYGTLSVLTGLCAVLVSRDVLDAEDLVSVLKGRSEVWRSLGSEYRALPAEILHDALIEMVAEKADVDRVIASSRSAIRSERVQ
jgi:hypothetical protein